MSRESLGTIKRIELVGAKLGEVSFLIPDTDEPAGGPVRAYEAHVYDSVTDALDVRKGYLRVARGRQSDILEIYVGSRLKSMYTTLRDGDLSPEELIFDNTLVTNEVRGILER